MIVCNPASTKICTSCNGEGEIWSSTPDNGPPFLWSEHKRECECCGGAGEVECEPLDYDGKEARLAATGQHGHCMIYGDDTASLLLDDGAEIELSSLKDIELCECS